MSTETNVHLHDPFVPRQRFRTFVWPGPHLGELSPTAEAPGARSLTREPHTPVEIEIGGLAGAVRAEIAVEYWGGHIGTSEQSFRINEGPWTELPQPVGTPGRPECYYRTLLGNPAVEFPVGLLREGTNEIRFHAGPQVCHDFRWGFFWVYAFTIRVFYEDAPEDETPGLEVSGGVSRADRDEPVRLDFVPAAEATHTRLVHAVARYRGFDWEGNGRFHDWHFHTRYGAMRGHVGTVNAQDEGVIPAMRWDTSLVPDQEEPIRVVALAMGEDGLWTVSRFADYRLRRSSRKVVLVEPDRVPEAFGVRIGEGKSCLFRDVDEQSLVSARLLVSTWSAAHADEIGLNGRMLLPRVGVVHDVSHEVIDVPPGLLDHGTNTFYVFSRTEHHAAEINWPGPAMLLEYRVE
jgi:hypothetical protein